MKGADGAAYVMPEWAGRMASSTITVTSHPSGLSFLGSITDKTLNSVCGFAFSISSITDWLTVHMKKTKTQNYKTKCNNK